eukprot:8482123-Alexandrium_andersonii.AAC.1
MGQKVPRVSPGQLPPPGRPRLAPPARAASSGVYRPRGPPDWCFRCAGGTSRECSGGREAPLVRALVPEASVG